MVLEAQDDNKTQQNYHVPTSIPKICFRVYDIRGPVDKDTITTDLAYAIGLAVGTVAQSLGEKQIIVGRDGRLSGPELTRALCAGLQASGMDVIFIGLVPTPVLYFATHGRQTRSGVMVTASHNPGHHNGFKIVLAGKTLTEEGVTALYQRICQNDFVFGMGSFTTQEVIEDYINAITHHITLERGMKVVIDCGNGAAGKLAPFLFRKLGCEVIELFCDIDGRFPNHHPDPTIPANLQDLINKVKETQADIGFAFDGDADRLGVVTDRGEIIWPDRQMMLFSTEILRRYPGAEIIFDVKCSRHLPKIIEQYGGKPIMWRTGHSMIKAKLFERGGPFAGELSGHIFFKDDWYGFDDGMYVGARLLQLLSRDNRTVSEIFSDLPNSINTPELKLAMEEDRKEPFMQRLLREGDFGSAKVITIDGIRLEFSDGWALVRLSNTTPSLTFRFEADNEKALLSIQERIRQQLLKLDPQLELPF